MSDQPGPEDQLWSDYRGAGLGGRLAPGSRPALVLIDPARAYTDPGSPLWTGETGAVAAMSALLGAARAASVPVFWTRVSFDASGRDGGLFFRKVPALRCFLPGDPLGTWSEGLEPAAGEVVVTKQYPSAFFGTSLGAALTALGVDTVVLGGFSTSGCVRASALDALQHGFVPLVVRDAVGDRQPSVHEGNLFDIQAKCGEVVSLIDATHYLAARR